MITFIGALMTLVVSGGATWAILSDYPFLGGMIIAFGMYFTYQLGHVNAYRIASKDNNE